MKGRGSHLPPTLVVNRRVRPIGERGVGRIAELARALAVLDTALEAIQAPVFVLDLDGQVLHANEAARILLAHDPAVPASLVRVITGDGMAPTWDLIPLRGAHEWPGFLAILRSPSKVAHTIEDAALGWHLTSRQGQVLDLVVRGLTNATIGEALGIGQGTVEFHLSAIFDKAGVDNRATLIAKLFDR